MHSWLTLSHQYCISVVLRKETKEHPFRVISTPQIQIRVLSLMLPISSLLCLLYESQSVTAWWRLFCGSVPLSVCSYLCVYLWVINTSIRQSSVLLFNEQHTKYRMGRNGILYSKIWPKSNLRIKGFIWLTHPDHNTSLKEIRTGSQVRNLETGEAEPWKYAAYWKYAGYSHWLTEIRRYRSRDRDRDIYPKNTYPKNDTAHVDCDLSSLINIKKMCHSMTLKVPVHNPHCQRN